MLYQQLQDAGLNETEAKIYLAALELGETTVSRIARKSGIKRTTVYLSLENLKKRGLISQITKGSRKYVLAKDPRNLEKIVDEQKEAISSLIPELLNFSRNLDQKPQVRYFEGDEGLKEAIRDNVSYPNQELCLIYSEAYAEDFDESFFAEQIVPERLKKNISVRAILPDNPKTRLIEKDNEKALRQTKFIASSFFNLQIEIAVYGNSTVSIISFREKFALIITSPIVHSSMKSIFETMWSIQSNN